MCIIGMLCLDIRLRLVFIFFPYVVATILLVNKDYYKAKNNNIICDTVIICSQANSGKHGNREKPVISIVRLNAGELEKSTISYRR